MQAKPDRDLDAEHADTDDRKYAYNFDYIHREFMLRAFSPFLTPMSHARALELGCYKGEFTKKFAQIFNDLTVVEGSQDLIAFAKARAPASVKFHHSYFETWELPAGVVGYDAIFLIHTLEHLDDSNGVLARVRTWLSPTGRLFVVVPNANAPSRQIAVKMGLIDHNTAVTTGEYAHGHRRTYNLDTLEFDTRKAGLKTVHRGGVMFKPLANFQIDKALEAGVIDQAYLEGCYEFGMTVPDLCASVFLVCERGQP